MVNIKKSGVFVQTKFKLPCLLNLRPHINKEGTLYNAVIRCNPVMNRGRSLHVCLANYDWFISVEDIYNSNYNKRLNFSFFLATFTSTQIEKCSTPVFKAKAFFMIYSSSVGKIQNNVKLFTKLGGKIVFSHQDFSSFEK